MKGVLLLKTLRQVHYLKKLSRGLTSWYEKEKVGITDDFEDYDDDEDDDTSYCSTDDANATDEKFEMDADDDDEDCNSIKHDLRLNLSLDDGRISTDFGCESGDDRECVICKDGTDNSDSF